MFLNELALKNFRLFENVEAKFNPGINIIHGLNAQGKTTLLEAIYYLAITKSFRTVNDTVVLKNKKEFFEVAGNLSDENENANNLRIYFSAKEGKHAFLNKQKIPVFSELIGFLPVTLLSLEDLDIMYGVPSTRRRFIDILISQMNIAYLQNLQQYKRCVTQKNKLLGIEDARRIKEELDIWNKQLLEYGSQILDKRIQVLALFNEMISRFFNSISQKKEKIEIKYQTVLNVDENSSLEKIKESFSEALIKYSPNEIKRAQALIGPHRDDIEFLINGKPIKTHGSQGENKTLLIALKLLENKYMADQLNKDVLFLLDDVFGELDDNRIKGFLETFSSKGQTFITTTSQTAFFSGLKKSPTIIRIEDKKIYYEA